MNISVFCVVEIQCVVVRSLVCVTYLRASTIVFCLPGHEPRTDVYGGAYFVHTLLYR